MKCEVIDLNVCRRPRLCRCGNAYTSVCDWKMGDKRICFTALCDDCSTQPAKGKDLCEIHAKLWANRQREVA